MSEKNDFIQLPPIKKDTPSEVVSMIWQRILFYELQDDLCHDQQFPFRRRKDDRCRP